ncbi:hypothetical protein SKAU_G00430150 [Synaphobranchus kaupii]|uniref:Uncharacterized protein n=1 Tax=Synaphobranchus kaupii TaxID=118154 RepID=A0A9Q1I846_SYNKA|nr:hypothetical protein SKAU_G00430150 [Synaphobranchus kaupii]
MERPSAFFDLCSPGEQRGLGSLSQRLRRCPVYLFPGTVFLKETAPRCVRPHSPSPPVPSSSSARSRPSRTTSRTSTPNTRAFTRSHRRLYALASVHGTALESHRNDRRSRPSEQKRRLSRTNLSAKTSLRVGGESLISRLAEGQGIRDGTKGYPSSRGSARYGTLLWGDPGPPTARDFRGEGRKEGEGGGWGGEDLGGQAPSPALANVFPIRRNTNTFIKEGPTSKGHIAPHSTC